MSCKSFFPQYNDSISHLDSQHYGKRERNNFKVSLPGHRASKVGTEEFDFIKSLVAPQNLLTSRVNHFKRQETTFCSLIVTPMLLLTCYYHNYVCIIVVCSLWIVFVVLLYTYKYIYNRAWVGASYSPLRFLEDCGPCGELCIAAAVSHRLLVCHPSPRPLNHSGGMYLCPLSTR